MFEVEAQVLTTEGGRALLAEVSAIARPGPSDLSRWRKQAPAGWVAGRRLAGLAVRARRKRASKFERAGRMWFDPIGVEQATAEPVARHKARRFAARTA